MNKKTLTTVIMAALLAFDVYYLKVAFTAKKSKLVVVGPYEFSKILGIALAVLCLVILVENFADKKQSAKIQAKNVLVMILTIVISLLFLFAWKFAKGPYIPGAIFMMALFTIYAEKDIRFSKKALLINLVLSVATMAFIYVVFEVVVGIRL